MKELQERKGSGMENKQKICDLLLVTLQATSNVADVVNITYNQDTELVLVTFASGGVRKINVAMDSGTAMIRDIMNNLGC